MRTYLLAAFSGSACPQVEIPNVEPEVNLYKLLTQLLHNEVVMFKFPPYFSTLSLPNEFELYTPYHLLWKKLKNTCRGLVEITIRGLVPYQGCMLLDSLMSMKNVQVIELPKWYFMDDSRLCTLAEQLPNLR